MSFAPYPIEKVLRPIPNERINTEFLTFFSPYKPDLSACTKVSANVDVLRIKLNALCLHCIMTDQGSSARATVATVSDCKCALYCLYIFCAASLHFWLLFKANIPRILWFKPLWYFLYLKYYCFIWILTKYLLFFFNWWLDKTRHIKVLLTTSNESHWIGKVAFHLLLWLDLCYNTAVKIICPIKWLPVCALANIRWCQVC